LNLELEAKINTLYYTLTAVITIGGSAVWWTFYEVKAGVL